jgi:hypothetical protein
VAGLLREHFPDLQEPYSRILFNPKARAAYLSQLRDTVTIVAERLSLTDRVSVCF